MAHTTKIHEKGSNLNTVCALFSNLCLWVYTVSACTNTWQTKEALPHTYKWLLNIKHGLIPDSSLKKKLSDIPTVLKMFITETIKWMWVVAEEWWKSDGNDMVQVDGKRIYV